MSRVNLQWSTAAFALLFAVAINTVAINTVVASKQAAPQAEPTPLDTFKTLPVFHHGRILPMDTLAKVTMEKVCNGGTRVKLGLENYYTPEEIETLSELKSAQEIFPAGKTRRMTGNEVLLSWMVEPDKWEHVPFLYAAHGDLHKTLGLKSKTETGFHRKYVSPAQVAESLELKDYLADHRDLRRALESAGEEFELSDADKRVVELLERYRVFRKLSHDPRLPLLATEFPQPGDRSEFLNQLRNALDVIENPNEQGQQFGDLLNNFIQVSESRHAEIEIAGLARRELIAMDRVRRLAARLFPADLKSSVAGSNDVDSTDSEPLTLAEAEAAVVELREATIALADQLDKQKQDLFSPERALTPSQENELRPLFRGASAKAADLVRLTRQLHLALYDNGSGSADSDEFRHGASIYVVPALNPAALERERDPVNGAEPWLSLPTVAYGSDLLLHNPAWKPRVLRQRAGRRCAIRLERHGRRLYESHC